MRGRSACECPLVTYLLLMASQVFEEYCEECEGQKRLVTRDPTRQDNALLPGGWVPSGASPERGPSRAPGWCCYCPQLPPPQTLSANPENLNPNAGLHGQLTGDHIYGGLVQGFRNVQYGGPPPCAGSCSFDQLLGGVRAILDIFVEQVRTRPLLCCV